MVGVGISSSVCDLQIMPRAQNRSSLATPKEEPEEIVPKPFVDT